MAVDTIPPLTLLFFWWESVLTLAWETIGSLKMIGEQVGVRTAISELTTQMINVTFAMQERSQQSEMILSSINASY